VEETEYEIRLKRRLAKDRASLALVVLLVAALLLGGALLAASLLLEQIAP